MKQKRIQRLENRPNSIRGPAELSNNNVKNQLFELIHQVIEIKSVKKAIGFYSS